MEKPAPDTRMELLLAALACFSERGFDGTSTRMIADRAGRPLSLLAHYFKNKEGLYVEVFSYLLSTHHNHESRLRLPAEGLVPRDKTEAVRLLREQVHDLFRGVTLESGQQDPVHEQASRLWLQEMRSPRPSLCPMLKEHLSPVSATLGNCIRALRPDLADEEATFMGISILGMVVGHGLTRGLNRVIWGRTACFDSGFQASECLVEMALHGLLGSPKPA